MHNPIPINETFNKINLLIWNWSTTYHIVEIIATIMKIQKISFCKIRFTMFGWFRYFRWNYLKQTLCHFHWFFDFLVLLFMRALWTYLISSLSDGSWICLDGKFWFFFRHRKNKTHTHMHTICCVFEWFLDVVIFGWNFSQISEMITISAHFSIFCFIFSFHVKIGR